jgi:hypothetical protein
MILSRAACGREQSLQARENASAGLQISAPELYRPLTDSFATTAELPARMIVATATRRPIGTDGRLRDKAKPRGALRSKS